MPQASKGMRLRLPPRFPVKLALGGEHPCNGLIRV
jgi:hypothetical protein